MIATGIRLLQTSQIIWGWKGVAEWAYIASDMIANTYRGTLAKKGPTVMKLIPNVYIVGAPVVPLA